MQTLSKQLRHEKRMQKLTSTLVLVGLAIAYLVIVPLFYLIALSITL